MKKINSTFTFFMKLIIMLCPIIWGGYIVYKYGVNVFFWDEWTYVKNMDHFFSLSYLWEQHNEHRMFFPKIVTFIIGKLFSWNSKAFMYVSEVFLVILFVIVIKCVFQEKKIQDFTCIEVLEVFVLGMCIFNACQYENMLWGFQIAWFMIVSLTALSYFFFWKYINKKEKIYFLLSMFLAIIVSFSSLHGLIVWCGYWIIFILTIFSNEYKKIDKFIWGTIGLLSIVCFVLYFYGYQSIERHTSYIGENINEIISFFIGEIGATMLPNAKPLSYLAGFVVLLFFGLIAIKIIIEKSILSYFPFITSMIMACGTMAVIALGRSGGDSGSSIASRYTTNSMLFLVFLLGLIFKILNGYNTSTFLQQNEESNIIFNSKEYQKNMTFFSLLLGLVLPILVIVRSFGELDTLDNHFHDRMHGKIQLCNYKNISLDEINTFVSLSSKDYDEFLQYFSMLEKRNYNTFADDIDELLYNEKDIPQYSSISVLSTEAFNTNSVEINGNKTKFIIDNTFENIDGYDYYLQINDKYYNMVVDDENIIIELCNDIYLEGINEVKYVVLDHELLMLSNPIYLIKSLDGNLSVADCIAEDINLNKYTDLDDLNMEKNSWFLEILAENVSNNADIKMQLGTSYVSGWMYMDNNTNKRCYLKLDDDFFELNWCDRKDVTDYFHSDEYIGFSGTIFTTEQNPIVQDAMLIVIDEDANNYMEYTIPNKIVLAN